MQLTPSMQAFVLHWGDMGSKWGLNRSVAQIHALLHLSPDPLTAEQIATTLNLARSNISTGLKELGAWNLIRTSRQLGDRSEYYTSLGDIFDLVEAVIAARREREFAPTLTALRDIQGSAEGDDTPAEVKARIAETVEAMQQLDRWYDSIATLPRALQLTLLKTGAKIADLLTPAAPGEPEAPKPKKKKKKKKPAPES
ncbi:GbsR/MarR family transcriptional regulator [Pseudooceanicola sp.]|uniref:GbsR/MarR family transcriptional regulator n=1 Tax=Pseudooceanicola sp. TaxID=1914328 RepID=UPI0035C69063